MPKDIVSIKNLNGGLNTFANPRAVGDNQLTEAINVETAVEGTISVVGGFDDYADITGNSLGDVDVATGGYGLFSYPQEFRFDNPSAGEGTYSSIAVFKPNNTTPEIMLYQEGNDISPTLSTGKLSLAETDCKRFDNDGSGKAQAVTPVNMMSIDGSLIVHSSNEAADDFIGTTNSFDVQALSSRKAGRQYFYVDNSASGNGTWNTNGIYTTPTEYFQHKWFVEPPRTGFVHKISSGGSLGMPSGIDWNLQSDGVGVIINQNHQDSRTHNGWGRALTTPENINFYASFVYEDNFESMTKLIGSTTLGGNGENTDLFNDATFYAVIRARSDWSGNITWHPEITAVRIYYAKQNRSQDTKYYIGEYPVSSWATTETVGKAVSSGSENGYLILYGDKTGKNSGAETGKGIYHYEPPRVITHAVNSGIRSDANSVNPRFKTGVLVNRKLYVGNIAMKTKESPEGLRHYGDRMLKSISNKFRVLPDTEYVDVAIRDGEAIVRLAAVGNMLLQFKENTLYVISVAGGSEYLSGTYKNMGVRHPNAVVMFEGGVFWVNEFGAYIYDGKNAPINLIDKRISLEEWSSFIDADATVGYEPSEKKFFVCGNSKTILDDKNDQGSFTDTSKIEFYVFNLLTNSWNKHQKTIGEGFFDNGVYSGSDTSQDAISNFINYSRWDGVKNMLIFEGSAGTNDKGKIKKYNANKNIQVPFVLKTKEYTSQNTHQRKSIYGVYITYKGEISNSDDNHTTGSSYVYPDVKLVCQNAGNTVTTTTLEPKSSGLGFTSATDWETAHYVVPAAQKPNTRNAYGVMVLIEAGTNSEAIKNNFKIADISIIMRLKNIK